MICLTIVVCETAELGVSLNMDSPLKLCVYHFIFLNLLVNTHAQDILSAILGGFQNGLNILNNNLDVGQKDYPDYGPANRDVSFRSNDVSQSSQNQNDSEEPDNSNSESRQGDDSKSNSEEHNRGNENYIEKKKIFPITNQKINNNKKDKSPKHPGPFKGNINNKIIKEPVLLGNQKPKPLEKERLASDNSMYQNKDNFNPNNVTTNNNGSTTSSPIVFLVNSTIVDKNIPSFSVSDSLLNQNTLNSTRPVTDKTVDNNKYVLKALTKRKFFFQAKPVTPKSEEVNANETVYYIDFD